MEQMANLRRGNRKGCIDQEVRVECPWRVEEVQTLHVRVQAFRSRSRRSLQTFRFLSRRLADAMQELFESVSPSYMWALSLERRSSEGQEVRFIRHGSPRMSADPKRPLLSHRRHYPTPRHHVSHQSHTTIPRSTNHHTLRVAIHFFRLYTFMTLL